MFEIYNKICWGRVDEAKNRINMSEDTGIHDIRLSALCLKLPTKTYPKALV